MKGYAVNPVLTHPAVVMAAVAAQRSPAQVVLRWALQHGQVSALQLYSHAVRDHRHPGDPDPGITVIMYVGVWIESSCCTC